MKFLIPILVLSISSILSTPVKAETASYCDVPANINEAKWWMKSQNQGNRRQGYEFLMACNELAINRVKLKASISNGNYMDEIRAARSQGLDTGGLDLVRKLSDVSRNAAVDRLYVERDQIFNAYSRY